MGYNFLVPNQSDEWIKKNEISKIFELEYSPSDTLNFYLVNEFNFDSNGYLINKGQSSVNYKWNNCEHFRYSYEDKYVFNKKDSFLLVLQYTIRYDTVKCFVNGKEVIYKPDTLKPTTEIWNKYKLKCYKSNMIERT